MPVRSWLAKAKSIHDIGGLFYSPLGGKPWDDKQDANAERRWHEAGVRPFPVDKANRPYFGSWMHDSTVLRIERSSGTLRLSLDSINAKDFAHHLAATLDWAFDGETVWPVDLVLHDASYVRAAYADIRGGLRFVDWERLKDVEFLYDWAFQQEGRLQWIAQLWNSPQHWKPGNHNVYLMVDCAQATAADRCPNVFARAFGEPAARLYLDAVNGIDEKPIDFNVFDSGRHTEAYIRRRMAAHGLTRDDFLMDAEGSPAARRSP